VAHRYQALVVKLAEPLQAGLRQDLGAIDGISLALSADGGRMVAVAVRGQAEARREQIDRLVGAVRCAVPRRCFASEGSGDWEALDVVMPDEVLARYMVQGDNAAQLLDRYLGVAQHLACSRSCPMRAHARRRGTGGQPAVARFRRRSPTRTRATSARRIASAASVSVLLDALLGVPARVSGPHPSRRLPLGRARPSTGPC
jgi:hypothetical protein